MKIAHMLLAEDCALEEEHFSPETLAKIEEIRARVRSWEEKLIDGEAWKAWITRRIEDSSEKN